MYLCIEKTLKGKINGFIWRYINFKNPITTKKRVELLIPLVLKGSKTRLVLLKSHFGWLPISSNCVCEIERKKGGEMVLKSIIDYSKFNHINVLKHTINQFEPEWLLDIWYIFKFQTYHTF